jgi:hypothetical protein
MRKCVPQDLFHRFRGPEPVEGPGGEETPVAGEGEDPVDHPESVVKVVAGEQDGCPGFPGHLPQCLEHIDPILHVQMRRRLVQQQHLRLPRQPRRQTRLLELPIAQSRYVPLA